LGFTVCQVPVTYALSQAAAVEVRWSDGRVERASGTALSAQASRELLGRTGAVQAVVVSVDGGALR
jgi:hypothetical protein